MRVRGKRSSSNRGQNAKNMPPSHLFVDDTGIFVWHGRVLVCTYVRGWFLEHFYDYSILFRSAILSLSASKRVMRLVLSEDWSK